jgi:hypothetical protein
MAEDMPLRKKSRFARMPTHDDEAVMNGAPGGRAELKLCPSATTTIFRSLFLLPTLCSLLPAPQLRLNL